MSNLAKVIVIVSVGVPLISRCS